MKVRSHGCWQEALVHHHMGFSIGLLECPHNLAAGFPQRDTQERQRKRKAPQCHYDLVLEVMQHHFCYLLLEVSH